MFVQSIFTAVTLLLSASAEGSGRPARLAGEVETPALYSNQTVAPEPELVVARIGPDGKPVLACVNGADAAQRFFETPSEKLPHAQKEK